MNCLLQVFGLALEPRVSQLPNPWCFCYAVSGWKSEGGILSTVSAAEKSMRSPDFEASLMAFRKKTGPPKS